MGTGWVIAAIAAAVAALQLGRGRARGRTSRAPSDSQDNGRLHVHEGLAPGSDSSADDTRPAAHSPANPARLDWNA